MLSLIINVVRKPLTSDGSETIIGIARGSSWCRKSGPQENNSSNRELHFDARQQEQRVSDQCQLVRGAQ